MNLSTKIECAPTLLLTVPDQEWRHLVTIPFPVVWHRFERRNVQETSRIRWFSVKDIPLDDAELKDEVVRHMTEYFLRDIPMYNFLNFKKDILSMNERVSIWQQLIEQRCALVCLEEDQNIDCGAKSRDSGVPHLVSCLFMHIVKKGEKWNTMPKGKAMRLFYEQWDYLLSFMDLHEYYGVEEYLYVFGLSVEPKYRGIGIGQEILEASIKLELVAGVKATIAIASIRSKKLFEKNGYEVLFEKTYGDLEKLDPKTTFPGFKDEKLIVMGRRLDRVLS